MEPMTDDLKEAIIREHPDGIWLVLAEEYPRDGSCRATRRR